MALGKQGQHGNIILFPRQIPDPKPDLVLEHLVSRIRMLILERGGVWDEGAQAPKIQRLAEILASSAPAKKR